MSKKAKLTEQHVSDIAQRVGDHLKQSGNNGAVQVANPSSRSNGKGAFFWGAASGIAVMLAAPLLRPAAKTIVKAGIRVGRQAQQVGESLKEEFQDIAAEARAQLDREQPEGEESIGS